MANTITATPVTGGASSGAVAAQAPSIYTLADTVFSGEVEETVAGNVGSMQKAFSVPDNDGDVTLNMKAVSATLGASSGNTTIILSDANYAGAGNTLELTLPATSASSDLTTAGLTVAGGSLVYLFIGASPAGHTDLEIQIVGESAAAGVSTGLDTLTAGDVLTLVQYFLNDVNVFWSTTKLYTHIGLAQRRLIYNVEPGAAMNTSAVMVAPVVPTATSSMLAPSPYYREWLAHYAAALALQEESDDPANAQRAAWHLEQCKLQTGKV